MCNNILYVYTNIYDLLESYILWKFIISHTLLCNTIEHNHPIVLFVAKYSLMLLVIEINFATTSRVLLAGYLNNQTHTFQFREATFTSLQYVRVEYNWRQTIGVTCLYCTTCYCARTNGSIPYAKVLRCKGDVYKRQVLCVLSAAFKQKKKWKETDHF